MGRDPKRRLDVYVLTTLECIFLTPSSARWDVGGVCCLTAAVVIAAMESPALERRVLVKLEANSLAV